MEELREEGRVRPSSVECFADLIFGRLRCRRSRHANEPSPCRSTLLPNADFERNGGRKKGRRNNGSTTEATKAMLKSVAPMIDHAHIRIQIPKVGLSGKEGQEENLNLSHSVPARLVVAVI